jgi:hypothetical protein
MRSMAGEHTSAIESLTQAAALGAPDAPAMLAHAQARALPAAPPPAPGTIIDISAILAPPPAEAPAPILGHGLSRGSWAARQWRLGLAQALAAQPAAGLRFAVIDQALGEWKSLPQPLARALLDATPQRQRQILAELAGRLESITAGPEDRVLVLGPSPSPAPLTQARARGAHVTLALAEPTALTTPHRVAPDLAAALHEDAPFDALLLAMPPPPAASQSLAHAGQLASLPMPPRCCCPRTQRARPPRAHISSPMALHPGCRRPGYCCVPRSPTCRPCSASMAQCRPSAWPASKGWARCQRSSPVRNACWPPPPMAVGQHWPWPPPRPAAPA